MNQLTVKLCIIFGTRNRKRKNYDRALYLYDQALRYNLSPEANTIIYFLKALTLKEAKRYTESLECFNNLISLNPHNFLYYVTRASVYINLNSFEEALKNYDIALSIQPLNHDIWVYKSYVFYAIGRYGDSVACCDHILATHPNFFTALVSKATSLYKMSQYQEALECLNMALIHMKPKDIKFKQQLLTLKGNIYSYLNCYQEARGVYAEALASNPIHNSLQKKIQNIDSYNNHSSLHQQTV